MENPILQIIQKIPNKIPIITPIQVDEIFAGQTISDLQDRIKELEDINSSLADSYDKARHRAIELECTIDKLKSVIGILFELDMKNNENRNI